MAQILSIALAWGREAPERVDARWRKPQRAGRLDGPRLRRHTAWAGLGPIFYFMKKAASAGGFARQITRVLRGGGTGRTGSHRIRGQGNTSPTKGEARRQGGKQGRVAGQRARRGPRRLRGRGGFGGYREQARALCQAGDVLHRWRTCLRIARYVPSACARIRSDLWRSSARLKRAPPRRWRPRMAAGAAMGRERSQL
jgi:hypothetical protein